MPPRAWRRYDVMPMRENISVRPKGTSNTRWSHPRFLAGFQRSLRSTQHIVDSAPVDVAVVDYLLADRNSEPLQAALKRRQIPFVVVSSYPRPLVRTEEGQEVLRKPVMPHELRCSVAAAVRRRAA